MSYGFATLNNANGDVVIDQDYRALEIFAEGTITSSGGGLSSINTITCPSGLTYPMFLIEMTAGKKYIFGIPTATTLKFTTDHSAGQTFEYKIAAVRNDANAGTGYGAAVWDASGRCVFSTARKYVRLRTALTPADYGTPEFLVGGTGTPYGYKYTHTSKPIPFGTFWHASPVPVFSGGTTNRRRCWSMRRSSTTELFFSWDGEEQPLVDPTMNELGYGSATLGFNDTSDVQCFLVAN